MGRGGDRRGGALFDQPAVPQARAVAEGRCWWRRGAMSGKQVCAGVIGDAGAGESWMKAHSAAVGAQSKHRSHDAAAPPT